MAKWWLLSVFLLGMAQANKPSVDLRQQFMHALVNSGATIDNCFEIATSPIGASVPSYQFQKMLWGSMPLKWQICTKTNQGFDQWKQSLEALLKRTFTNKIQILNLAQRSWVQWEYCSGCFAQGYEVVFQDGKHKIWIEYHKYQWLQGAITTRTTQLGGVIRIAALN